MKLSLLFAVTLMTMSPAFADSAADHQEMKIALKRAVFADCEMQITDRYVSLSPKGANPGEGAGFDFYGVTAYAEQHKSSWNNTNSYSYCYLSNNPNPVPSARYSSCLNVSVTDGRVTSASIYKNLDIDGKVTKIICKGK